jgi:FtsP/CotA-like multicopper oxidase with cupredoxin domain
VTDLSLPPFGRPAQIDVVSTPSRRCSWRARCPISSRSTASNPVPDDAHIVKETVNVGRWERYDVVWTAREPGRWILHCHIPHHTTNNNVEERGGGGLTLLIEVAG